MLAICSQNRTPPALGYQELPFVLSQIERAEPSGLVVSGFGNRETALTPLLVWRRTVMLDSIRQDLAYAFRQLRLTPGFTVVATLSLALGIGANTAIFQLVDAIRLRMLPVENPSELVYVDFAPDSARAGSWSSRSARLTSFQVDYLRQQQRVFSGVLVWSATRFNMADAGEPRYAEGLFTSSEFFRVLGVQAIRGRTFTADDDTATCGNPGAVISHDFWQRNFGGDAEVLSKTLRLNGRNFPVIGITPPGFYGVEVGRSYDVAIPLCADKLLSENGEGRAAAKDSWWLSMLARLKPGVSIAQATAHLEAISPGLMRAALPSTYKTDLANRFLKNKIRAQDGGTGVSGLRRQYERPLLILMATTALVLLIACANLANLLLARASIREREMAVRLAIGASRGRLTRQLLAESLLLALGGAALGIFLAQVLTRSLVTFLTTQNNPLYLEIGMDWRLIGFTAGLAIATCLLFGLVPALRATRVAPASAIRSGGRSVTAGRERFGLRRSLVVTQVALSLVLLVGALLFVRSLRNLMTTDAGFQSEGVMMLSLDYQKAAIPNPRRLLLNRELAEKIAAVPGIVSVAETMMTPMSGSGWNQDVGPDGTVAAGSGKESWFNRVSPGYFNTMGTKLLSGREFTVQDTLTSPKVAIVNEAFARKFYNGKVDIVGRTFRREAEAGEPESLYEIVGVVKSSKYYELREEPRPVAVFPTAQNEDPGPGTNFALRVAGSPSAAMAAVRSSVLAVNPIMGVEFRAFSTQIQETLLREQLMAILSGAFAVLAVFLATLGLYGVIAYMVARRRNEIGVRMALGADRSKVVGLVLRETLILMAAGLAVGGTLAYWAGQGAASLLYGLKPNDTVSLVGAAALLGLAGLLASYAPARRAASLDPMQALREE